MKTFRWRDPDGVVWSIVFALVALWTLSGALPGYFFAANAYQMFYGHAPASAEVLSLFQGSWGQTLLFGLGYAWVAWHPSRHALLVALGAVGKTLFAVRALSLGADLSAFAVFASVGDLVIVALMVTYLVVTRQGASLFRRP